VIIFAILKKRKKIAIDYNIDLAIPYSFKDFERKWNIRDTPNAK